MIGTPGRRERKKTETRVRVQRAALDLFERHGYGRTTVEQIADAADVSTTTFFRYFPTKDDTVAHNGFTPLFLAALAAVPVEVAPLAAVRAALHSAAGQMDAELWTHERRRQQFVLREPDLRGPTTEQLGALAGEFARLVALRVGRTADDQEVRTFVGAVFGVFGAVVVSNDVTAATYIDQVDAAVRHLEAGLPLG